MEMYQSVWFYFLGIRWISFCSCFYADVSLEHLKAYLKTYYEPIFHGYKLHIDFHSSCRICTFFVDHFFHQYSFLVFHEYLSTHLLLEVHLDCEIYYFVRDMTKVSDFLNVDDSQFVLDFVQSFFHLVQFCRLHFVPCSLKYLVW